MRACVWNTFFFCLGLSHHIRCCGSSISRCCRRVSKLQLVSTFSWSTVSPVATYKNGYGYGSIRWMMNETKSERKWHSSTAIEWHGTPCQRKRHTHRDTYTYTHTHTQRVFGVHPPATTTTTRAFFFLPFVSEYWYNILISHADNILPSSFKKEKENRKDSNSYALYIYSSIVSRV